MDFNRMKKDRATGVLVSMVTVDELVAAHEKLLAERAALVKAMLDASCAIIVSQHRRAGEIIDAAIAPYGDYDANTGDVRRAALPAGAA